MVDNIKNFQLSLKLSFTYVLDLWTSYCEVLYRSLLSGVSGITFKAFKPKRLLEIVSLEQSLFLGHHCTVWQATLCTVRLPIVTLVQILIVLPGSLTPLSLSLSQSHYLMHTTQNTTPGERALVTMSFRSTLIQPHTHCSQDTAHAQSSVSSD